MKNKTPDEILYEKIRNYCLAPWKSTRKELPPYGVPVLMAWHHDRSSGNSEINGFAGYSFGVGARYYYEEKIEGDKVTVISSHLGEHLTSENFQAIDQCYHVGLYYDRTCSYDDLASTRRRRTFGIKDPYLKSKSKTTEDGVKRYDYWVNFSEGKYGSCFKNLHAADISFIPESTVNTLLEEEKKKGRRFEQIIINAEESEYSKAPDYWMVIPKLK